MSNKENINAARELAVRYRTITIGEIRKEWCGSGYNTAQNLTGFGSPITCILCKSVNDKCIKCIYDGTNIDKQGRVLGIFPCLNGINRSTYDHICDAKTPIALQRAFRRRADLIESHLKNI